MTEVIEFFSGIPESKQTFRYAENKWTPKELLLHIADAERVFSFRALTLGRGDTTAVFPNMDENIFAENVDPSDRSMQDIVYEFEAVRMASIYLFNNLTPERLRTKGNLFGYPVTPYGFAYIIIGHTLHHMKIINERYLNTPA